eukprot:1553072-Pyramimonas_sp.AAC.1
MAFNMGKTREFCDHVVLQLGNQVEFGDWHDLQNASGVAAFTGRRFQQDKSYAITIDMGNYIDTMTDYR